MFKEQILTQVTEPLKNPESILAEPSLGRGYGGLLLLFATLDLEEIAHSYVFKIKETIEAEGLFDLSLFNGVSGICFALQQASFEGSRYQKMLSSLQSFLFERLEETYFVSNRPFEALTDVVQGLSGIGRYLLETPFVEWVQRISSALISLCKSHFPSNPNMGLAHGIPGILAYLSIAALKGVVVDGQREMIRELCNRIAPQENSRQAWCYGTPGVSRALFLAGKALNDAALKSRAGTAFREVISQNPEEWKLSGPMLCHGIAGLLTITLEMAKEKGYEDLKFKADELYQLLLTSPQADTEGFLEGSAGVALALLSYSNPNLNWHIPLLIHG